MIIDEEVVITGSFNFTWVDEEYNAEHFLIIRSKGLAREYFNDYKRHRDHSEDYGGR